MRAFKVPLSLLLAGLSLNLWAGVSIISDLDDTIKVTNSGNLAESAGYGAARRKVYTGMAEFLNESEAQFSNKLTIITASPRMLRYNVERLLEKHQIKADVILNANIKRPSKFDFKVNAIKSVMDKTSDSFILMGDDVGEDPEVYDEIMKLYPGRILASYIHIIKNRQMPESAIKYYTTYELALRENLAGRLSASAVKKVYQVTMNEKDLEGVFPEFAHCPTEATPYEWQFSTPFENESRLLSKKLTDYCKHEWDD